MECQPCQQYRGGAAPAGTVQCASCCDTSTSGSWRRGWSMGGDAYANLCNRCGRIALHAWRSLADWPGSPCLIVARPMAATGVGSGGPSRAGAAPQRRPAAAAISNAPRPGRTSAQPPPLVLAPAMHTASAPALGGPSAQEPASAAGSWPCPPRLSRGVTWRVSTRRAPPRRRPPRCRRERACQALSCPARSQPPWLPLPASLASRPSDHAHRPFFLSCAGLPGCGTSTPGSTCRTASRSWGSGAPTTRSSGCRTPQGAARWQSW